MIRYASAATVAALAVGARAVFAIDPSSSSASAVVISAVIVVGLIAGLIPGFLCAALLTLADIRQSGSWSLGSSMALLAPSLVALAAIEFQRRWRRALSDPAGEARTEKSAEHQGPDKHLVAEHAVTRILADSDSFEEAAPRILQAICENLGFDIGELWRADERDGWLHCAEIWSIPQLQACEFARCSRELVLEPGVGLPGRVWDHRAPAWISDLAHDLNFPRVRHASAAGLCSGCAFPVTTGQECFGVMEFFGPEIAAPNEPLLNMMAAVGSEIGQFIRRKRAEAGLQAKNLELFQANQELTIAQLELRQQNDKLVRARAEVEAERARYESLFQFAPDAYIVTDLRGMIAEANCSAAERFNIEPAALVGTALPALVHAADRRMFRARLRRLVESQSSGTSANAVWELGIAPPRRTRFDAALTVAAVRDEQGRPIALRWLIHDITERKRTETELAKHRDQLEDLVKQRTAEVEASHQKLRQSERMTLLGTLAHGLGHDVGNLAFPMLCRLDTLAEQALPEQAAQDIRAIRDSVMHLRELAAGLSVFARDPGEPVQLLAVTRIDSWWSQWQRKLQQILPPHVMLQSEFPSELSAIAISPHQLTLVIRNLVINSGESITGPSGVVRIWARASDDQQGVFIGVTDNGRGMTEEVRQHAMEPFFTTKKRTLSTGLGLCTVHGIVAAIGGTMEIESAPGRGTTVVITLPAADEPEPPQSDAQRGAYIGLQDQRLASYAAALLKSASFSVTRNGSPDSAEEVIWITEPAVSGPDTIRQFLGDRPERRAIVIGSPSDQWNEPRIEVIDGSHRAMHKALQKAVIELA